MAEVQDRDYEQSVELTVLETIEKSFDIKILYAAEFGSRTWGFSGEHSDHDIGFIYVQRLRNYLKVSAPSGSETIVSNYTPNHDVKGYDLRRAMTMLTKGDPTLQMLFQANPVYIADLEFNQLMVDSGVHLDFYRYQKAAYHYLNVAKANYDDIVKAEERSGRRIAHYVHGIHALLNLEWTLQHRTMPPADFQTVLEECARKIGPEDEVIRRITFTKRCKQDIKDLKCETISMKRDPILDQCFESRLKMSMFNFPKVEPVTPAKLAEVDRFIHRTILKFEAEKASA